MKSLRTRLLIAGALTATLAMTGCSAGSGEAELTPEEVLAAAKTELDETSGVHIVLSTEKLPGEINGILNAEGVGTHAPAFEGALKIATGGITADVDVVAVDGTVYAKLPFTQKFVEIEASEYNAPDPATLMETEGGLSALLTAAEDVTEGEPTRSGELVLTEYTGTVPGSAVAAVIPSASAESDFDATFTIAEDNRLNEATLTGPFYPGADDVTYTITFDEYGSDPDITAP